MKMQDKIVINDYIENDPLSEENLDKTLENVNKIRLSCPNKSIWIYSGYTWSDIWCSEAALQSDYALDYCENVSINHKKRQQIISKCTVMVDGKYIDSQRDISLRWRGSKNQRVINIQQSLQKGEIVLWTE